MIKKYLYKKVAINKNYFYNPYFKNGSTEKILKVLENIDIKKILKKHFFNRKIDIMRNIFLYHHLQKF